MAQATEISLPRAPLVVVAVSWLLLLGTFVVPLIPLDGSMSIAMVRVADSGSTLVVPFLALTVILLLVTRRGLTPKRRLIELFTIAAVLGVVIGGGSFFNEHLLKPLLGVARPNAVALDDGGTLGTSLESYYSMPSKTERSAYLKEVLENPYFAGEKLSVPVRDHWILESGHSLPSGHTLGAFTLLTFGVVATSAITNRVRFAVACLLVPWAVSVAYSRVLLRVHWPNDVLVSGMAGILIGIGIFVVLRKLLWTSQTLITQVDGN